MGIPEKKAAENPTGAVLVVGGGIGGIQTSLDLAESGFRVYLLEEESAIGGTMAQLDKTFPTNDCSMCIVSPKLVEVGRHRNIDIISYAEVEHVSGEPGHFTVRVRQKPRYVSLDKCTGCGDCAEVCPVSVPSEFDARLITRKAIYKRYPQAIPNAFAIDKSGTPPCTDSCPAGIHVQGYVALIARGKFREALALIRKHNPLPGVCGRVCTHPCEQACTRRKVDDPVAIMSLKRFVSDREHTLEEADLPPVETGRPEKVAVVGSGPAGLSAAFHLACDGYGVTVFEARDEPGGMLFWGIPDYRLPRDVLKRDIGFIERLGVEIRTGTPIGPGLTIEDLMRSGYSAVFLAAGAWKSMRLGIEGEDLPGVVHGIRYLREVKEGRPAYLGERVAVIGGGNVAIDAARTALRGGARQVLILYRRSREEMPALAEEVLEAEEEGIVIKYLAAPQRILEANGRVTGLKCIRMQLGEPDESGRRRPMALNGTDFTIGVDAVIPAVGQSVDPGFLSPGKGWSLTPKGTLAVDPVTYASGVPGIFAGGDMVSGPATVVEAVGAGREAAVSISRFLQGADLHEGREKKHTIAEAETAGIAKQPRLRPRSEPFFERSSDFREVQQGLSRDEAVAEAGRCLNCGICSECLQCTEACMAGAVLHDMLEQHHTLTVGSIVLSPGFEPTDPAIREEYGYGRYRNVVTSLEFERILSASGPYQGRIRRPSDETEPGRIAWIQCVGSRDPSCGRGYCSSVCCMYATKEAVIAREHSSEIRPTIFYMDIRAHGKGFDRYYERARNDYGVRYVRCQISRVVEKPSSGNLLIAYISQEGAVVEEEFELVVLSLGMSSSPGARALAERLGIGLNSYGFCQTDPLNRVKTSRPGVYVCGAFESPKDIPETVSQASSAAACASEALAGARGTLMRSEEFPPERDTAGEAPRIGVFVCHCGINIGGVVDVPAVTEYARTLPGVVYADQNLYTCSQDTQSRIRDLITEHRLNRVVVASCSPRTHEPLFQETIRQAGLNRYLFEMANIRDQCSWVHMSSGQAATRKAKDLVRMSVAAAGYVKPLQEQHLSVTRRALIVGGGASGMQSALGIADQGFDAVLVEREKQLGGNLLRLHYTIDGTDVQAYTAALTERVMNHPRIRVILDGVIVDFSGFKGNFTTGIMAGPGMAYHKIEHGVAIIATGGEEYKPDEYLYGRDERVMTQQELEEKIAAGGLDAADTAEVVMIQCVGSRDDERPYCSRICCSAAIKNALKIKALNPGAVIYILYRDIRTYGFLEDYYSRARASGIMFISYDPQGKPVVSSGEGGLTVSVIDPDIGEKLVLHPRILALSTATVPRENDELASLMKLQRTSEKFFLEAHMKLRPVDFATDGMYLCGLAHSPKPLNESLSQSSAAVSRACTLLSRDTIAVGGMVAWVDAEKCAACLTCVRVCPFEVPFINDQGAAQIDAARCQGCGSCAAECPGKAIQLQHCEDAQILAKSEALFGENNHKRETA